LIRSPELVDAKKMAEEGYWSIKDNEGKWVAGVRGIWAAVIAAIDKGMKCTQGQKKGREHLGLVSDLGTSEAVGLR